MLVAHDGGTYQIPERSSQINTLLTVSRPILLIKAHQIYMPGHNLSSVRSCDICTCIKRIMRLQVEDTCPQDSEQVNPVFYA